MTRPGYEFNELTKDERNWYKKAKNWPLKCPICQHEGIVSEFVKSPYRKISHYGFDLSICPNCEKSLKFDYENKRIDEITKGRKPFPIMIGTGRIVDLFVLLAMLYLLFVGKLSWQPIAYLVLYLAVYLWELFLKKNDEIWYVTDVLFEDFTDRIAKIGFPVSIVKGLIIIISGYSLIFQ